MSNAAEEIDPVEAAQARVTQAQMVLAQALIELRDAKGEPHDENCPSCKGTGEDSLARLMNRPNEPCDRCHGRGRTPKQFPLIVNSVDYEENVGKMVRPNIFGKKACWVSIRPCGDEHKGKTYLGWYLGDMPLSTTVGYNANTAALTVGLGYFNPAIFVPDLSKVVFGCESWWGEIRNADDLRQITDSDIESVWYVRALKDLGL